MMKHPIFPRVAGVLTASLLLTAGLLSAATPASASSDKELFVSLDGHGRGCTEAAPCTIEDAQWKTRKLVSEGKSVTVTISSGRYDLDRTLEFSAADSGNEGAPVVWRAEQPGSVVLSGGTSVTGWSLSDAERGVWVADVPEGSATRQVYVDGAWTPIAQASAAELGFTNGWRGSPTGYSVTESNARAWLESLGSAAGVEFVYSGKTGPWTQSRCLVDSVVAGETATTVTMLPVCWDGMTKRPARAAIESGGLPNMSTSTVPTSVENHPSLLSSGEWYLDETAHKLYYALPDGQDIEDVDITLPHLERLMTVAGTLSRPVHDIRFEGIQFSYATWLSPSHTGFAEVQSNLHITGAPNQGKCTVSTPAGTCPYGALTQPLGNIDVSGSSNIAFVGNTFRALGGAGLSIRYGAQHTLVEGNHITETSSTGIYLGCTFDPQPLDASTHQSIKDNCTPDPDAVADDVIGDNEILRDTRVANNVIHAVGRDYKAAPGVTVLFGQDLDLVHNEIFDTPYTAITGGIVQGHATDARAPERNQNVNARNEISHNLLYNYMQDLHDGGAIYLEGHQAQYVYSLDGSLDIDATLENGMLATGNVAFNDGHANFTYYDDAGAQFIRWQGNVAMNTVGASQGGCSPAGYLWTTGNYFAGQIGSYPCSPPALALTVEGNTVVPERPSLADVPESIISTAGLEPAWAELSAVAQERLRFVSDRAGDGRVLLAISGLSDMTQVYAGAAEPLDVRRVGATFAEVIVPDELDGRTISLGEPDPWVRVNETDPSVTASGWNLASNRSEGDYQGDVLYTTTNGATATITFTGTRVRIHGERNSDQGLVEFSVDGGPAVTVDTATPTRFVNVPVFEADLSPGTHTVTMTKRSGQYALLDGYSYIPIP